MSPYRRGHDYKLYLSPNLQIRRVDLIVLITETESYKNGTHYHVALILHPLQDLTNLWPQSATPILQGIFLFSCMCCVFDIHVYIKVFPRVFHEYQCNINQADWSCCLIN